jgi:hypothetical protein
MFLVKTKETVRARGRVLEKDYEFYFFVIVSYLNESRARDLCADCIG